MYIKSYYTMLFDQINAEQLLLVSCGFCLHCFDQSLDQHLIKVWINNAIVITMHANCMISRGNHNHNTVGDCVFY